MTLLTEYAELDETSGGRYQQTIRARPIAYRRDGNLRRLTNVLGPTGDPALSIGIDELAQVRVRPRLSGQSPVLFVGCGNSHIRLTPLGTNNVDGIVAGNAITFAGAWTGADLRYTVAGHRMQKDVLLRAGHPGSFAFRIDEQVGTDIRLSEPVLLGPANQAIPLRWVTSQQGGKRTLTTTLPSGDRSGWTLDPTVTIQPDGTGLDTYLRSDAAATNFGGFTTLFDGDTEGAATQAARRTLIAFPLTSIPAHATLLSVTLSMYEEAAGDTAGVGSWAVGLRRALRNWVEAEATWNIYSTGNNWITAGAGSDGNDRAAADSATLTLDGTAANNFVSWSGATLLSDFQSFLNGSLANYGHLVQAPTAEMQAGGTSFNRFCSSDHATAANRPKLVIVYKVLPTNLRAPGWGRWH